MCGRQDVVAPVAPILLCHVTDGRGAGPGPIGNRDVEKLPSEGARIVDVRSDTAAEILTSMGFERVYDLGGGIVQWDGALAGGSATTVASADVETNGMPVMYEFYTDW